MSVRPLNTFLLRVVPWPTADYPGYVNIHWMQPGLGGPAGRPFTEHVNACRFTFGMANSQQQRDLYVCMSLQARHGGPAKSGKLKAARSEDDVVAIKALYIDCDIKDGKFRDTTHALTAFGEWRRKIGMPMPTFVLLSGSGGFHAHWVFDKPATKTEWEPLARALVNAGQIEGFVFDYKITTNPVCILRIPETFNHKTSPPNAVALIHPNLDQGEMPVEYPLTLLDQVLTPFKVAYAPRVTQPTVGRLGKPSPVFAGVALPGRLDDGIETYVPTIEEVAAECPFIDATLQTGGRLNWEPLWRESLRVAAFVQDGEEVAHELSDGHVGYTEVDTDKKFAEVLAHKQQVGWPQCRAIYDAGGMECKTCPHLPQARSPLNFAKPAIKAAIAVAAAAAIATGSPVPIAVAAPTGPEWLPLPYRHDRNRLVYQDVVDPNDKNKIVRQYVFPLPMFNFQPFDKTNGLGQYMLEFSCGMPGMERRVSLTYDQIMDLREMGRQLGSAFGVPALPEHLQSLRKFDVSYLQQLHAARDKVRAFNSAPFGLFKQNGQYQGFVYNLRMYNSKDPVPVQPLSPRIAADYTAVGDLSVWKGIARLITDQKRPELIAPICVSMGAPLMRIAGLNGAIFHLFGDSGSGKSAALKLSQSVWGSLRWMAQLQDTANSIDVLASQLHSLPLIWDEVLKGHDRRMVDTFLRLGQGNSKKRSRRDGQDLGETHEWFLPLISASNQPMIPHLAEFETTTVAPINRVFEVQATPNKARVGMLETGSEAERMFGLLNDNYGLAGLELAKFYGANYDTVVKLLAALTDSVHRRGNCTDEDRFHRVTVALALAGGMIGNKLGLISTDMDHMEGFLMERLQDLQGQRRSASSNFAVVENVERLLGEFVAANRNHVLITQDIYLGNGRPPNTFNAGATNAFDLKGQQVDVRIATNHKIVRISQPAFNAWLKKERKMSFGDIRAPLSALPNVRFNKWDLSQGVVSVKSPRVLALEIVDPSFWDFN